MAPPEPPTARAGSTPSRPDLSGRVALVTGAARRTGRALALAFAEAGADVAVHCQHSLDEANEVVEAIRALGRRARLVQVDLVDAAAVESAFSTVVDELGAFDILVNNVGTIVWKTFDELTDAEWRSCLDGTLFVTLNASRAASSHMRRAGYGRIVNILDADADAQTPVPYATAYKLGKKAAYMLTKTMAVTEGPHGITVNAVSPGTNEDSEEKPALTQIPAGRYGTYEDIENAVLFLASDAAGYITSAHLKVSGGYLV